MCRFAGKTKLCNINLTMSASVVYQETSLFLYASRNSLLLALIVICCAFSVIKRVSRMCIVGEQDVYLLELFQDVHMQ